VADELLAQADAVLAEAADRLAGLPPAPADRLRPSPRLAGLLQAAADRLRPFPRFPGAEFETLEVPPPGVRADVGCVVLAPDGRLYEYELNFVGDSFSPERIENLKPLDLTPAEFIAYAYTALSAVARVLERRAQGGNRWTSS